MTEPALGTIRSYWDCPHSEADEWYDEDLDDYGWTYECDNPATTDAERCLNCPKRTDGRFNPYGEAPESTS